MVRLCVSNFAVIAFMLLELSFQHLVLGMRPAVNDTQLMFRNHGISKEIRQLGKFQAPEFDGVHHNQMHEHILFHAPGTKRSREIDLHDTLNSDPKRLRQSQVHQVQAPDSDGVHQILQNGQSSFQGPRSDRFHQKSSHELISVYDPSSKRSRESKFHETQYPNSKRLRLSSLGRVQAFDADGNHPILPNKLGSVQAPDSGRTKDPMNILPTHHIDIRKWYNGTPHLCDKQQADEEVFQWQLTMGCSDVSTACRN
ncbi:unnamed protein product [Albugo candida]|uniref:Uncharacterized protein n=1 Tax=Albugo candida TaxID=65357 RepID=A0A024GAQ8_9STRA|nr:unnamed protein product [Albugo candida]|eukprot:CCI43382.1 unnamed protein product [Albugo candida]